MKGTTIMSNIEASLESIDKLIAEAKAMPFSSKLLVDEEELSRLVEDIRLNMPVEITQAKKIAQERRDILNDAEAQAEEIIDKARQRADIMVEEHQITKEAKSAAEDIFRQAKIESEELLAASKQKAEDMTLKAEKWSNDIRKNASAYVESIIKDTDETLTNSVNDIRRLRQSIKGALGNTGVSARPEFKD